MGTVNLQVRTQTVAYNTGYQTALSDLVDSLVEGGDVNFLLDALEMKLTQPEALAKFRAYYANRPSY
ncbi:hypothetical protein [Microbacterium sp. K5D]|uniref:hypothetical protein n=1 Tax=Microbacterium sp. K5D TaxID=2305436 RepID=UPI00109C2278|nr:hypothetical protein [Microbacterium sp. K5D]